MSAARQSGDTPLRNPEFNCAVTFDPDMPCVLMEWRGYATSAMFREANERVLAAILQHGASRLLGDIVDFVLIGADDQRWLNQHWIPRVIAAGLRRVALVQPIYYFNRVAVESVIEQVDPARLSVGYFPDRPAARQWLLGTDR